MSIVWKADATQGVEREFASYSTHSHCSVVTYAGMTDPNIWQIADPTAAHGRAYHAEINAASNSIKGCWTSGIREEINMGNPNKVMYDGVDRTYHEGQERWISVQFNLDPTFPTHATYRGSSVFQIHPAVNDGGLFNLGAGGQTANTGNQWEIWGYQGAAAGNRNSFQAPLGDLLSTRGKWVKFTFHVLFSSAENPAVGFFECYSDVQKPGALPTLPLLYSKYNVATMKSNRAYHFQTFGFYPATRPIVDYVAMKMCGLTCATDRASAEANAFGSYTPPSGNPPVATFTTSPSPAAVGAQVTFDASGSSGVAPLAYAWVDGVTNLGSQKVQGYVFQVVGTKRPTLTVTDVNGSASVEHDLVVNASNPTAPVAAFTTSPSPAAAGVPVTFDATASTGVAPLTYRWTDGATVLGTSKVQAYTFSTAGTMRPTLTITDANGTTASIEHDLIVSGSAPPVAAFTTSPSPAQTGQVVTFDATASTGVAPLSYVWTDANGGSLLGSQKVQTFTFQAAATKRVTLLVTDGAGLTTTVEHDLVVTLAPTTPFPRGDLQSPPILAVGGDYFIKVVSRLPSNLPTAGLTAMRFASIDGPPATATPALALGVTVSAGAIHWCLQRGASYGSDIVWTGPVVTNMWHEFILHVNLASDVTGYVELWMDGAKQTFTAGGQTLNMITYGSDNNGGPNWLDIQSYRNSGWLAAYAQGTAQGGSATPGTLTIHHAPPMIGPTYESVNPRTSTIYHVDNGGVDTADGLTAATAWKTVGKVNRQIFQPGDTVLFTGGQTFGDAALECYSSGTAENPVTFGASGTGRAAFPLGIHFSGYNYLTFDSLAATPAKPAVDIVGASRSGYIGSHAIPSTVLAAGCNWERSDVGDGTVLTTVSDSVALGFSCQVIYNPVNRSTITPAQVATAVVSIATRVAAMGVTEICLFNEPWYTTGSFTKITPIQYAAHYGAAKAALIAAGLTGIKLIAGVTGDWEDSGLVWHADPLDGWTATFINNLPAPGVSQVDAWDCHPYPHGADVSGAADAAVIDAGNLGWPAVASYRNIAIGLGSDAPWYITETGAVTDGTTAGNNAQQAVIARMLKSLVTADGGIPGSPFSWVKRNGIYAAADDGSGNWGMFDSSGNPRPAWTGAVLPWIATATAIPFDGNGNGITVNNCLIDALSDTTVTGSVTLGISAKGNNWTVTNNTVRNTGLSGVQWYGDTLLATGNTITNIGLRSFGSPNPAVGYNAHGLYLGQSGFPGRNTTCTTNTIYNPTGSEAMMESGISQRSNNGTYTGNTIHHAAIGIDFYESDPVGGGSSTWSGNTIHDTTAAAMFVQGPTGGDYPTSESFTIQNNTIGPPISGVGINVQASYTTGTVNLGAGAAPMNVMPPVIS